MVFKIATRPSVVKNILKTQIYLESDIVIYPQRYIYQFLKKNYERTDYFVNINSIEQLLRFKRFLEGQYKVSIETASYFDECLNKSITCAENMKEFVRAPILRIEEMQINGIQD